MKESTNKSSVLIKNKKLVKYFITILPISVEKWNIFIYNKS